MFLSRATHQPFNAALRHFSTTVARYSHYDTLSLHRAASKAAVKASFYKLSKRYHPDVNTNDKGAKEKFQAVSEAYSVLGDDRRRRAYDRELSSGASMGSTSSNASQTYTHRAYYYDPSSMYENRRRGASYAWENQHRNRGRASHQQQPPPHYTTYTWGRTHRSSGAGQQYQHQGPQYTRDPFSSAYVRRATGHRAPFETKEDQLKKEPAAVRVAQVLGIIFFIVALNGGFSASAG